jgi:hypothetical protein
MCVAFRDLRLICDFCAFCSEGSSDMRVLTVLGFSRFGCCVFFSKICVSGDLQKTFLVSQSGQGRPLS